MLKLNQTNNSASRGWMWFLPVATIIAIGVAVVVVPLLIWLFGLGGTSSAATAVSSPPYGVYPWYGWFPFGGWWFVIPLFFIGFFFLRLVFWGGWWGWGGGRYYGRGYDPALELLKERFARGEITQEQFAQMKRDLDIQSP